MCDVDYLARMAWEYLIDQTIGAVRLRVAATGEGFVVTRISAGAEGQSLRITRRRFALNAHAAIGQHCLAEALSAGEVEATRLRGLAQQAVRKAFSARETMRPGCTTIRRLEQDGVDQTKSYLAMGQDLAHACAAFEQTLDRAGFPTGERVMPTWIAHLFETNSVDAMGVDVRIQAGS